jgi:pimeloyl-ACP methyl ester carboxylesterase
MKIAVLLALACLALGAWLFTPDLPRATLERRYGIGAGDYVTVAGVRLCMRISGPEGAPVLVLLHGFGSSLQTWDAWAASLSNHFRVVRYDLPGFGLTGADPTGDYSVARGVAVLAALLDKLGVARASLVGNSMGGMLAWQFAAAHPDRVDRLVLVSPDGFASPGFAYGKAPDVPLLLSALPYTMPKFMLRLSLAPAFADPAHLTDALVTRYWDMMRAPGVRRAVAPRTAQTILVEPSTTLARIKAPTLLLWGERDGMIPIENALDYLKDIPNAQLVRLAGLGHVPQEEAPGESLKPVTEFLAASQGGLKPNLRSPPG